MSSNLKTSESKFLERSRSALTNAGTHEIIKPAMEDYGIGETQLSEGWGIYNNARCIWELNNKEDSETKIVKNSFEKKYESLTELFKRHRNQSLIFFKKKPDILITLGVKGRFPDSYSKFFDKVKQFYTAIQEDPLIQTEFDRIKITSTVVSDCLTLFNGLLAERSNYTKELGESQDATKSKDAALNELKEWMDDFDAIAKIALYDQPQLLEVLGIFVRS